MSYSGALTAREAREGLSKALQALQQDPNLPPDVMAVAQNVAQAVGALFEAERASTEPDGKSCVRNALGFLSQTLALLQGVRGNHHGISVATEVLAQSMSKLYPLTTVPSKAPVPHAHAPVAVPQAAPVPQFAQQAPQPQYQQPPQQQHYQQPPQQQHYQQPPQQYAQQPPQQHYQPPPQQAAPQPQFQQPAPAPQPSSVARRSWEATPVTGPRQTIEANIGATTESNFFVGFSGDIGEGGVFIATYESLARGTPVEVLVTLPGGYETKVNGRIRFVRDPLDFGADSEPGMGIQFESLTAEQRDLILRFIRKRPPIFYDD